MIHEKANDTERTKPDSYHLSIFSTDWRFSSSVLFYLVWGYGGPF